MPYEAVAQTTRYEKVLIWKLGENEYQIRAWKPLKEEKSE